MDPDKHVKGYQYAERLGVDSIAFICYDPILEMFLLNNEYKPPVDMFITGAFGGSIDKNKGLRDIVVDEAKEEAGFVVEANSGIYGVWEVGKVLVSTQMNQFCYLFLVSVDRKKQAEREPENAIEAMAKTVWMREDEIAGLEDWKAITIVARAKRTGVFEQIDEAKWQIVEKYMRMRMEAGKGIKCL